MGLSENKTPESLLEDSCIPEISNTNHQVKAAIPDTDQGILTEYEGFCTHGGFCKLGEKYSSHASLGYSDMLFFRFRSISSTCMMTPTILWTDMRRIAEIQFSVVALPPYL